MKQSWNFDTSYTMLPRPFFRRLDPVAVRAPELVLFNDKLARGIGLDPEAVLNDEGAGPGKQGSRAAAVFAGNRLPEGATPLAMAYAGHQFGVFTLLGDGRALLLGEHVTPSGKRFDIQLKGSGPTPYSRGGDGRAALGPMLREYIVSEAMHGLGIPTTRSLAVAATGEDVYREDSLSGAVLTRVASSHLRVGTFQFAAKWHGPDAVRALADYALRRHYPEMPDDRRVGAEEGGSDPDRYLYLLKTVTAKQADLLARWQLVGFIHGVMNTDNMTISGETIDYGPCAFMDVYDLATVFSSIDHHGRYAYGNQPAVAQWNLARFAETLLPLLHENEDRALELAQEAVSEFSKLYRDRRLDGMRSKLGLSGQESRDAALSDDLLELMLRHKADYTNTFRALTLRTGNDPAEGCLGTEKLFAAAAWTAWHERWQARLARIPTPVRAAEGPSSLKTPAEQLMRGANPAVIPRNHRVEAALTAAVAAILATLSSSWPF